MLRLALATEREKRIILNFLSRKTQKGKSVEMNTTDYLMSNSVNRERLLQAMDDIENGRNLVYHDLIEL
ncbi:MAG: hypothetical protein ABIN80_07215 [Dyadobacter sp.]|uniref:hypothetical protein n=1 Tax=Dyadobacter sp. TaxID=1914288 RepID=UPI0032677952